MEVITVLNTVEQIWHREIMIVFSVENFISDSVSSVWPPFSHRWKKINRHITITPSNRHIVIITLYKFIDQYRVCRYDVRPGAVYSSSEGVKGVGVSLGRPKDVIRVHTIYTHN